MKKIEELSEKVQELQHQRTEFINSLRMLEQTTVQTLQSIQDHQQAGCDLNNPEVLKLINEAHELRRVLAEEFHNYELSMQRNQEVFSSTDVSEQG